MNYKILSNLAICLSALFFLLPILSFSFNKNYFFSESHSSSINERNFESLNYPGPLSNEIYDPLIGSIASLEKLKGIINQAIDNQDLKGIEIPIFIDDLLRKKFLHGSSSINLNGNWMLQLIDLSFPSKEITFSISPEDVAKSNRAICSQQAILFQELVKEFGFEYESVGFNIPLLEPIEGDIDNEFNHFASAVKVKNDWYYFDSNLEPEYDRYNPKVYFEILSGQLPRLRELYPKYKWAEIEEGMIYSSSRNKFPAKNGLLIQQASKLISYFGWLLFLVIAFIFYRFSKKNF